MLAEEGGQCPASAHVLGANDRVNIGIIGLGKKGTELYRTFSALPGVDVVAVCDADATHMASIPDHVTKHQDLRRLIDMPEVDAVVIVTPDHWHCLAGIWAVQAGKHAYVEKPISHTIWEGRRLVEAARKYNRVVQTGTQQRSCPAVQECAADLQNGVYGNVQWIHCCKLVAREPIGKAGAPRPIPNTVDYDLWAGPTPLAPVNRCEFHYDWHWQWQWGTGEMGNWGIHFFDDVRHLLGWKDIPDNAMSAGNRWWDDDGETPTMHMCLMRHRDVDVVVDIRIMADAARNDNRGAVYLGCRDGNYIMCDDAVIRLTRGGGSVFDKNGREIKKYIGNAGQNHQQNFIDAVRRGTNTCLACDIETGHLSSTACHMANISYRLGQMSPFDSVLEAFAHHQDAVDTLNHMRTQLEGNGVDLAKKPFIMGPKLTFDLESETFTGAHAQQANALVRGTYREPFVVPEQV